MEGFELVKRVYRWDLYDKDGHKIASTLDGCLNKLSTKNCQAIELGYDLDELAEKACPDIISSAHSAFKAGFQKALELMGHRLSKETEWQVELEMEFVGRGKHGIGSEVNHYMPKRDADGCLILKLKSE